jgi:hypothetical protein
MDHRASTPSRCLPYVLVVLALWLDSIQVASSLGYSSLPTKTTEARKLDLFGLIAIPVLHPA